MKYLALIFAGSLIALILWSAESLGVHTAGAEVVALILFVLFLKCMGVE